MHRDESYPTAAKRQHRVPGSILIDRQGLARIPGPTVDLGAYELADPEHSTAALMIAVLGFSLARLVPTRL